MHLRTRTWFGISLLCFLAAAVFWQLGQRKAARDRAARENLAAASNAPANPVRPASPANPGAPGTPGGPGTPAAPVPNAVAPPHPAGAAAVTNAANNAVDASLRHRLSNTPKSVDELSRSDHGLLLRNALIDSSLPVNLDIPPHLRAQGDPGSYLVQSRGPLDNAYRALLRQAGAEIVAYVPNNAYLARVNEAGAKQLGALPQTQVVLPWEPYYKLDSDLLDLAVDQKPLPP